MKIILSGGGTGGHIYPALSIAQELKERDPQTDILYVGKKGSLEEKLVQRAGLDFKTVRVKGLPRKSINMKSVQAIIELLKGTRDAGRILKDFKPDLVVGTGGYVSAPILLKAQRMSIPTLIQEQNAYPGKTNRLLARKSSYVALSFEEAKNYFPSQVKPVFTGNPIREDFLTLTKEEARKNLDFDLYEPMVLSFGGSGGQEATNEAILSLVELETDPDFQLVHITGNAHYEKFMARLPEDYNKDKYIFLSYSHEIPSLLSLSSLVVSSPSAIALAEISAVGVGSILIPKPYTAGNHQFYNAKSYEGAGASLMIEEKDLTGQRLLNTIYSIIRDKEKQASMAYASTHLGNPRAVEKIVDLIYELV
ncbi:MAG: undecaprenyldiphospho-muramoylpentapeptide beta-N-acetylglucosaminyltransferase [Tissierellia bacterium]|nr:undecaprenyldiphospho-muramoylpentapeptide beta-N-acetylglucosaminyltransferase [Tissierellia bacterium]